MKRDLLFQHLPSVPRSSGPHGFQERLAASQEAMKNKNVVNLGAIRQGMKRFQFLLNCCEPGTIPDASILAAALDLVQASLKIVKIKTIRHPTLVFLSKEIISIESQLLTRIMSGRHFKMRRVRASVSFGEASD